MSDPPSGEYHIVFTGDDATGRYYSLEASAPYDGITIDEAAGTVTFHEPAATETTTQP